MNIVHLNNVHFILFWKMCQDICETNVLSIQLLANIQTKSLPDIKAPMYPEFIHNICHQWTEKTRSKRFENLSFLLLHYSILSKFFSNLTFSIATAAFHQFSDIANSFGYFSLLSNQLQVIPQTPFSTRVSTV